MRVAPRREQSLRRTAIDFGISESCLNWWLALDEIESGDRAGVTKADSAETRELKKRNRILEEENLILRRVAAFTGCHGLLTLPWQLSSTSLKSRVFLIQARYVATMRRVQRNHRHLSVRATPPGPVVPTLVLPPTPDRVWRRNRIPDSGPVPWLDRDDASTNISQRENAGGLSSSEAQLCRQWIQDGYVIVRGLLDDATLDEAWQAYERRIKDGHLVPGPEVQGDGDTLPGRLLNPHWTVPEMRTVLEDRRIVALVETLLGASTTPLQTIAGHKASQQPLHSDAIHMTTHPEGYVVAAWIAFEDIESDAGPLEFLPGSHRLPTVTADDLDLPVGVPLSEIYTEFELRYTPLILDMAAMYGSDHGTSPDRFIATKGDVLFWHAHLLHGGSMRTNYGRSRRSRRSMVCHYVAKGCVCYHDLSGTLSHLHV